MNRVDRKDLKDAAFDVVLRGYDKRQVDERLRTLGAEAVRRAGRRCGGCGAGHDARGRAESLAVRRRRQAPQPESDQSGSDQPGFHQLESTFGARVEKILMLAEEEAREVRSQAEQEAAAIRKAVAQEADGLFKAAARDADEVCKAARVEAAQLVVQARAEADRLVTTATENVQQRERVNAHELQQLSQLRDEINTDLYRAKEVLDGLFGATEPIARATPGATTRAAVGAATAAAPAATFPSATFPSGARRPQDGAPDRHQARTV
ncbi:MAG: hypothetical protein ACRDTA_14325 [Pseudonocardiaceae bacterium]